VLIGVARRLLGMLVTLFGVAVIIFVVLRLLPGNAVTAQLGVSAGLLSHAQIVALDHYYGVGEPFFQQFGSWAPSSRATWASRSPPGHRWHPWWGRRCR
jgi:ABC-type dipeptide/oligopeptide/nickel transport system permease component